MAQEEKVFADGFIFKRNEKAPEFVVGRLSMKVDEAIEFIKSNQKNGWVNLGIKQARSGNYYVELDTFEAKNDSSKGSTVEKYDEKSNNAVELKAEVQEEDDDLPF